MRIVTLLARHGTGQYPHATSDLDELFALVLPEIDRDLVVIDTALPEDHEEQVEQGRVVLGSSNAHWEFSAWDRGFNYLGARIQQYDLVHLATSAFGALDTSHLYRLDLNMLDLIRGRAAALGHIDYYNDPVVLLGRCSQAWIRSSWIFLPTPEVRLLGSTVSIASGQPFFSNDPVSPFRVDAPLSVNYQKYVLDWLTGAGTGQGVEWHSRFALSAENLAYFQAKTLAVLNEHMLAIRLRAQGCALVDIVWLATQRKRMEPTRPLGAIPTWPRQIAARDSHAALPSRIAL